MIAETTLAPWTRKHDRPGTPFFPQAVRIVYPRSLEEVIALCAERPSGQRLKAAGSHWALSEVAFSDHTFVETHDPNNSFPAMGRTLTEVVPRCLSKEVVDQLRSISKPFDPASEHEPVTPYLVHVESGKRVYQLYAELDAGFDDDPQSLARFMQDRFGDASFMGPWGFATLGGAGGQTVLGALTTGTHGGDINLPPIADAVRALHLVVDGGKHYWIEPATWNQSRLTGPLTDDAALRALYGETRYGGPDRFEIIRDDRMFEAVLVGAGRFGVVYSLVIEAVRQYCLQETRELFDWQTIRGRLADRADPFYAERFLQIAINLAPIANGRLNRCGVTKRRWRPLLPRGGPISPPGRDFRRGPIVETFDGRLNAPRFAQAGSNFVYSEDPVHPGRAAAPNFLARACMQADFLPGVATALADDLQALVDQRPVEAAAAVVAVGVLGGAGLALLLPFLPLIIALLRQFAQRLEGNPNPRFGEVIEALRDQLLDQPTEEGRLAGLFAWRALSHMIFEGEQGPLDYTAISYAVMDRHDYKDRSCRVNVDSCEVFFDALGPDVTAFVDRVLQFERDQEVQGRAAVGYISLRYTGPTRALLGPQRWPLTCAVEVSALKDVNGSGDLVRFAATLARNRNLDCRLHWGQRNDSTQAEIEYRFGDAPNRTGERLGAWRAALAELTDNGRLDGFSSEFTRRTGLEVVTPAIAMLEGQLWSDTKIIVRWNCRSNPPNTRLRIDWFNSFVGGMGHLDDLPLDGEHIFDIVPGGGQYDVTLEASLDIAGERRTSSRTVTIGLG